MRVHVRVPASSGNTGSGFDATGMALALYNELVVDTERRGFSIRGEGEGFLADDETNHCVWAMHHLARETGRDLPGYGLELINRIPISRGLGSSSAALISGLLAANALLDEPLGREEIVNMATGIEGHPDNVVPSMLGGVVVSVWEGCEVRAVKLDPPETMTAVVWVPEYELSTSYARSILPEKVPLRDAVFNLSHAALFAAAFAQGRYDLLSVGAEDRLHQPYRQHLVPGMREMIDVALESGALAGWLSGAGPCVIALCNGSGSKTVRAMREVARACELKGSVRDLRVDNCGAKVRVE